MKPTLFGGSDFERKALFHAMAFSSAQNGVPSGLIMQVKPLVPDWRDFGLPSCIMMMVALATICSGAAVLTLSRYAGSEVGTSSVGNAPAGPVPMSKANTEKTISRNASSLARGLDITKPQEFCWCWLS